MLINLRNALMAGKRLPYDAEVEYLESTGTQYIDTGVKADGSTVVKCALSVVRRLTNGYVVWGAAKGDGSSGIYDAVALSEKYNNPSTLHLLDTYNNNNMQSISYGQDLLVECVLSDGSITINGTTTSHNYYTIRKIADYPIWVFGENLAGKLFRPSHVKLSFLQILQSDILVRDFIPVRKGTVGYLYDRVSGKLFGNAGTGDFVLGPDVVPVEWLQTDGSAYINTGLLTSSATDYDIRFSVSSFATGSFVYGTWNDSSHRQDLFIQNNGLVYASNGGANVPMVALAVDTAIDASQRSGVLTIYGRSKTFTDSTTFTSPFYLLATNRGNNTTAAISGTRLYFCKLWNNSVLERNLLPVSVGQEGAMMDTLTRRIYRNAGTGAFGYGNDLKYPIPAE